MMKFFRAMAVIVLACLLCTVSILPAFAETAQESPRLTPGPADYVVTEESGGEFRPLPIDMTGGAPLGRIPYSADMNIYQDPTIRVERHRVVSPEWNCTYYYAFIEIKDPSQLRTAAGDDAFRTTTKKPVHLISKHKNAVLAINGDYFAAFRRFPRPDRGHRPGRRGKGNDQRQKDHQRLPVRTGAGD